MQATRSYSWVTMLTLLAMLLATPAYAASLILYVDVATGRDRILCGFSPNRPCKTISYVIPRASVDTTIQIGPGTYNETISITQNLGWITFQGAAQDQTVIVGNGTDPTITVWGPNTFRFRQLTITGGRHGIYMNSAHIYGESVTVSGNVVNGIRGEYGASVELSGVAVRSNGRNGVYLTNGSAGSVLNSEFSQNGGDGFNLQRGSSAEVEGSMISNNLGSGIGIYVGSSASVGTSTIEYNHLSGVGASNGSAFNSWGGNLIRYNADSSGWRAGVNILNGSSGVMIDSPGDQILMNNGPGIFVGNTSSLLFNGSTVSSNAGNGVEMYLNSTTQFDGGSVTNNSGYGVFCGIVSSKYGQPGTLSGNALGPTNCN